MLEREESAASVDVLERLAEALAVDPTEFLSRDEASGSQSAAPAN
jgi:transcriptional regulator with XRE-family HTH domain